MSQPLVSSPVRAPAWGRTLVLAGLPTGLGVAVVVLGLLLFPTLRASQGWGLQVLLGGLGGLGAAVLLLRWAVWGALAAVVAGCLPLAVAASTAGTASPGPTGALVVLLAAGALLVGGWRSPAGRPRRLTSAAALVVALLVALAAGESPSARGLPVVLVLAALACLVPVGLALVGRGRAGGSPLVRLAAGVAATSLAPLPLLLLAPRWGAALAPLLPALAPAAGALGLTALLRGRRGEGARRAQLDDVDRAALADFDQRYGVPRLGPLVLVVAAYNEAEGLPAVLDELPSTLAGMPVSVVVVDDGSSDGTAEVVRAHPRAYLVAAPENRGQGAALRLGYRVARQHGARLVVTTDADGQYDPADLPALLRPLLDGSADFVTGSRTRGRQESRDRFRRVGVHVFAWAVRLLTGAWVTDTSYGMRAMRTEVTATVTLNQPQYQSSELLIGADSHGFRISEVPGTMRNRSAGTTKKGRNLVYGARYARVVLGTWWREGAPSPVGDRAPALRVPPPETEARWAAWRRDHRPFGVALVLGALVRLVVQVGFPPALVYSDGPTYLSFLADPVTSTERPVGYPVLVLWPLLHLADDLALVAVAQHLLGLVTAVVLYALLRRRGVGGWLATLATLPLLFDTLTLVLEHSVLSDTLFVAMLVGAFAVLAWRPVPSPGAAWAAGLLLGGCTTVRLVGEPLVAVAVLFCLLVGAGWGRRLVTAGALVLGCALPIGAYVAWYHADHDRYALAEFGARSLYLRSTSFVDCATVEVPDYARVLCPQEPLGHRRDPTYYLFHDPRTLPSLQPPSGVSRDEVMSDFARAAIVDRPVAYVGVVVRDTLLNFDVARVDRFGFETAHKWGFEDYLDKRPTAWTGPAYAAHGGRQLDPQAPWAQALAVYSRVVYLPGPALLACLVVGVLASAGRAGARGAGLRPLCVLLTVSGLGLLVAPAVTAEFVWRYQLPALALLPAAAAVGLTALRGISPGPAPGPPRAPTDRRAVEPTAPGAS